MALVFSDGFEFMRQRGTSSSTGAQPELSYLNISSISLFASPVKEGINGHNYIRITSSNGFIITQLPNPISSGILSFLCNSAGGGNTSAFILASVIGNEQDIVAIRTVSYSSVFPNIGYTMEVLAGGVQIGTFFWPMNYLNVWARWTLVWSTEGPDVTAALYREGELIIQGTGGQTGIGVPIDSYRFQTLARSTTTEFDSVTVWDNPVSDIQKAKSSHWVGISRLSEDFPVLPQQGFTTFSGTTFPASSSSFPTLASSLITTNASEGMITLNPAIADLPLVAPEIDGATAIHGITIRSVAAGTGNLTTATSTLLLDNTPSLSASKVLTSPGLLISVSEKNPITNLPWQIPQKHILINSETDGGFESGLTFQDNGWIVLNHPGDRMGWFCGEFGAISGSRGAFLSREGFGSTNITINGTFYSYIMKEITIPQDINQVQLEFFISGAGTNSSTMRFAFGLVPISGNPWFLSSAGNSTLQSNLLNRTLGYGFYLKQFGASTLFTSSSISIGSGSSASYVFPTSISIGTTIISPLSYKTDFKRVIPGETYRIVFGAERGSSSVTSIQEPLRIDNISLIGYEGDITKLSARFEAS